ncbi:MAG: phosphatidate cytidylyltransferase [bacterium]|jgi:phosphatidate cytidylyltransferase|nr:phosphatidate cytidylyltransferase [bacterium]
MHTRRIITSLIALPIFLTGIFWSHGDWFTAFVAFVAFAFAREELYSLMQAKKRVTLRLWQNGLAFCFFFFTVYHNVYALVTLTFLFFWGSSLITNGKTVAGCRNEIATHALLMLYLLFPLACFVYLRSIPSGPMYLFFLLAVACFTDIGGFYGGKFLGKHKLAPIISPKKTWEGFVCGALLSALIIGVTGYIQSRFDDQILWLPLTHGYLEILLVTILMSIVGQIGDLCESSLKRDAGIKDSGSALTGHGGFLDMMDAMLWIGPTMFVYVFIRFKLLG